MVDKVMVAVLQAGLCGLVFMGFDHPFLTKC